MVSNEEKEREVTHCRRVTKRVKLFPKTSRSEERRVGKEC